MGPVFRKTCMGHKLICYAPGSMYISNALHGAAAKDGFLKQSPGFFHDGQGTAELGTGALAHNGYIIRVAAKGSNVLPHPAEGLDNIQKAAVSGLSVCISQITGHIHKSQGSKAVIHIDNHHAFSGKGRRIDACCGRSFLKGAAVNPAEDRKLSCRIRGGHI